MRIIIFFLILVSYSMPYQWDMLADKISLQLGKTVEKNQIDPISKRVAVTFDGNIFVLLDVPEFYKKIRAR